MFLKYFKLCLEDIKMITQNHKIICINVVDVFMDPSAGCGFTCHISIKKARIGEPKLAIMRAYTALLGFCKHIFIYDDDINIHDPIERGWALAHRFIPGI